jgi:hypothetical protein
MFRPITLAGVVLFAAAAANTKAPPDDRGRPVILLVHGRGMADRDTSATRKFWLGALISGIKTVARDSLVAERDVRIVWYADVLDPRSTAGCDYDRNDPRARREATEDPQLKSLVSLAGDFLGALTGMVADTEATSQLRGLAADASFLSDAQTLRGRAPTRRRDRSRATRRSTDHPRRAQLGLVGRVRLSIDALRQCARQPPGNDRIDARIAGAA